MPHYTFSQWMLFFFFYCFCGWVWECCYVSVRQRRWVNRGFLQGPLLPIYGSGALIILLATLAVRNSLILVFLLGMIAATILEYFTGAAMEKLFGVRYWDYSSQPFNLNGHICLFCSLGWGVFSLIMVHIIHPPVERLMLRIPEVVAQPLATVLAVLTTVDAVQSFNAAMNLKELLEKLAESSEELQRAQKRLEVYYAFAEDDLQRLRDRLDEGRFRLEEKLQEHREERAVEKAIRRTQLQENLERRRSWKLRMVQTLTETLEEYRQELESELSGTALEEKRTEIAELLERLEHQRQRIHTTSDKSFARANRILRANPSAMSHRFAEGMEELRRLGERK